MGTARGVFCTSKQREGQEKGSTETCTRMESTAFFLLLSLSEENALCTLGIQGKIK